MVFHEQLIHCDLCGSLPNRHFRLITTLILRRWPGSKKCRLRICRDCGLVFVSPRLEESGYEHYYREVYYQDHNEEVMLQSARNHKRDIEDIIDWISKSLDSDGSRPNSMIDVGCGIGDFITLLGHHYSVEPVALELSHAAAEFARKEYGLHVMEVDLNKAFDLGARYDFVSAKAVLEHILSPSQFVTTLKGLLTEHGVLFLLVPDLRSIVWRFPRSALSRVFKPIHVYEFTKNTITQLLDKCGLEVIEIDANRGFSSSQKNIYVLAKIKSTKNVSVQTENWIRTVIYVWLGSVVAAVSSAIKKVVPTSFVRFLKIIKRKIVAGIMNKAS